VADVRARGLVEAIRRYGHFAATLDPLGSRSAGHRALQADTHGLSDADLDRMPAALGGGPDDGRTLGAWVEHLRHAYSATTAYQVDHLESDEEQQWWRAAIESDRTRADDRGDPAVDVSLLDRLTDIEAFERVLHRAFPGRTRFSLEGLDVLVPILDVIARDATLAGARTIVLGMGHRGRLNVLAHVLEVPVATLVADFVESPQGAPAFPREDADAAIAETLFDGDVIYHLGASRRLEVDGRTSTLIVPPNPSHLEAVDPVAEGMARAAGTTAGSGAAAFDAGAVLAILVHGDAAFTGQGVVAETLNLGRLDAYTTGGTIHLIANNQIGFTTGRAQGTSLRYPSDLVLGFGVPVVHVNADDVPACLAAARLVLAYRRAFRRDVVLDVVGYRRYGHNEGDEPSFTQPLEAAAIDKHARLRERWARDLEERGALPPGDADGRLERRMASVQAAVDAARAPAAASAPESDRTANTDRAPARLTLEALRRINSALVELPDGFAVHPKLVRVLDRRRHALDRDDDPTVDWALAETLAIGATLADGVAVRLTGQDTERGTFSQRHAVLHDVRTGQTVTPLARFGESRASFEIANSPLSENAALGFEYGYSVQEPLRLVIWEAQYGDFVNGAEVVVDEFLVSGRVKWAQANSLVLLLPHGVEGAGPDHASARPERWLQLAAQGDLQLANCTTAAQYFHLLRRHASQPATNRSPLVVFTPKSLLRHPLVASSPRQLIEEAWRPVIGDATAPPAAVRRVVFCSGKVAVDLLSSPRREEAAAVAVVRVEQLFPLPIDPMRAELARYPNVEQLVWIQEEPENMGAWDFVRGALERLTGQRRLSVVARRRSASASEGSAVEAARVRAELIDSAFS